MTTQDTYALLIAALFVLAYVLKPVPEASELTVNVYPTRYSFMEGE